jgi:hypothetical protein
LRVTTNIAIATPSEPQATPSAAEARVSSTIASPSFGASLLSEPPSVLGLDHDQERGVARLLLAQLLSEVVLDVLQHFPVAIVGAERDGTELYLRLVIGAELRLRFRFHQGSFFCSHLSDLNFA